MKAEFWNKTGLDFWTVQELALRHKAGRTGRRAEGHSHYEWCFYGFCFINFRKLNDIKKANTFAFFKNNSYLCPQIKIECIMCTVNIQVDEALLRDVKPELDSTTAIRLWAQELINLRIQELINEDEETMDIEEARAMVHETIRKEYALP